MMAAGAQMVKLEGGAVMAKTTEFLVASRHPRCAHIGLTPQSAEHRAGRLPRPGQAAGGRGQLRSPTRNCSSQAGAADLLMEAMPATVAKRVSGSDLGS